MEFNTSTVKEEGIAPVTVVSMPVPTTVFFLIGSARRIKEDKYYLEKSFLKIVY